MTIIRFDPRLLLLHPPAQLECQLSAEDGAPEIHDHDDSVGRGHADLTLQRDSRGCE